MNNGILRRFALGAGAAIALSGLVHHRHAQTRSDASNDTTPPAPVTYPVDLSSDSSGDFYDESVNFEPGFAAFQRDPNLADLFDHNGVSQLCMPTSIANAMADQAMWRSPNFPNLQLAQIPGQGDYTQQVRKFTQLCQTDTDGSGTPIANAARCIRQYYQQSGYPNGWAYIMGQDEATDPISQAYWGGHRDVSIDDIRHYLSQQAGVIMDVAWEKPDGNGGFTMDGGHAFWLVGYDYNFAWSQNQIMLKIVNPDIDYSTNSPINHFDPILMTSFTPKPGVTVPSNAHFILEGIGFRGITSRAMVKNILIFLPDNSLN